MEFLTNLLDSSTMPWLSAFVLGLMTAISPCPLATNITAVGFISKDIKDRNRVFINGVLYTLGRAISYTAIALIIYFGADQFKFSGFFQIYGEKILGPLLIIIGLFMLDVIKNKVSGFEWFNLQNGSQNQMGIPRCNITRDGFRIGFLSVQWCSLFWNVNPDDCCKRFGTLSSHCVRTGNRHTRYYFCMDIGLYGFGNRWCL